jgi:MFS family permease
MTNSQEMESRYASLKQARDKGSITDLQFRSDVAQLRLQASDGFWYQIDPGDGHWLKWDGRNWKKAVMPAAQQQVPQQQVSQQQVPQQKVPRKFFPLLGHILKTTLRTFKQQLPMMIFFGILGWLLHTYLLVVINEGFGESSFIGKFLATQKNGISGTIIWMVVSGILFGWIGQKLFSKGRKPPKSPPLSTFFREAGGLALAAIAAAAGLSMIIGLAANTYGNLALAVGFGGIMLTQGGSVVGLLISSAWSSTYGLAQSNKAMQFSAATGRVAMLGGILGFLLNSFMPVWGKAVFGVVFLVGAFLLARRQGKETVTALFSILLPLFICGVAVYLLWHVVPAFADDGGWKEAGGSFADWIKSQGATKAMVMGIGPGIGTMVGPAISQALSSIGGSIQLDGGGVVMQPPPGPGTLIDADGNPVTFWEPGKYRPGSDGNEGKPGYVWFGTKWISAGEAQDKIAQEIADKQAWERQAEENTRKFRESNAQQLAKDRADGAASIAAANAKRAQDAALAAQQKQFQDHMVNNLNQDPSVKDQVNQMAANGDVEGLKDMFKDKMVTQMAQGQKDAAYYNTMATVYGAGEVGAKLVVAGAKGALIAVGGPAGMVVTGVAVGSISATQEGTQSYVNGDSVGQIVEHTTVGFVSGVKDGVIGVYTQMPGISTTAKYLIPAGADAGMTFIQGEINDPGNVMGNLEKAVGSGALSIGSTYIGGKVDSNTGGLVKEGLNVATGGVAGAVGNVIQGGDPGEGAIEGIIGAVGGRVGGHMGTKTLDYARSESEKPVQIAIGEANTAKQQEIGIEGQSKKVQDLADTMHEGESGKTLVDEHGALDQLRDTQSSRTAKQAPDEIKDAIIDTRKEKIYKPADDATVAKAKETLKENGMLQPGDEVKMDTFSTPGKPTSLGADRDARLVIERADPENPGKTVKIEVPREHWENDAYKDFYEHTTKIAGGEQAITPEKYPGYFKKVDEMTHNNPEGLTQEQIQHRAWAEEHNQLFTDKNHIEASRDNSDQLTKFIGDKEVQTQVKSNVENVQAGKTTLLDPEGYAKMWHEKSDVYARMGNQPEAVAQSQKGIEQYMKIRQGYDKQGLNVPPMDNQTAKAMEIITKSPVGVDATPQAMAEVNKQLQSLGFKDTNDALGKVAMQNETVGFAQPKGISTASTTRISISGIDPPPRDPGQPPDGTVY